MINLIFLTLLSWSSPATPADSLRTETIDGKLYIIHRVEEKETLYSLSRRYGTPVAAILDANAKAGSGLDVGQLLKIPYTPRNVKVVAEGVVHKVAPKETLFSIAKMYLVSVDDIKSWNDLKSNSLSTGQEIIIRKKGITEPLRETPPAKNDAGKHVVQPKETLFAISRKYGVSVDEIRRWNNLTGTELKVGSVINVKGPGTAETREIVTTQEVKQPLTVRVEPGNENKEVKRETKEPVKQENVIRISENVQGSDEVKEGGLAELIEGTEGNRKYLGLHRTVKAGTILKVRNELNNREVFVRIVGPLPDTGVNDNVVIKISKSAYERLGAIDPKFRVEVTYYK